MGDGSSLRRRVIGITWPMIVSELVESAYSLADTYFVSRLGTAQLAGVGVASYVSWLLFSLTSLFSVGTLIYVAQAYGAGEVGKARRALGTSIPAAALVTVPIALAVLELSEELVSLVAGPGDPAVVAEGSSYLAVRVLGLPLMATLITFDASLRAVGATRYSMITIVSSALLNVVLDPILIFGWLGLPALGVAGAALATVLSIAYAVPLSALFLRRVGLTPALSFDRELLAKLLRLSVPATAERVALSLGNGIYVATVARCGAVAMAAHQVGVRIESLVFMPGFAFSIAASSLVGQSIGAGRLDEGRVAGYEVARVAVAYMTALGVAVALAARYIAAPFSPSEEVLELATLYLVLAGLSEPGLAAGMVFSGAIRGAGNTLVPMVFSVLSLYVVRALPAYILAGYLGVLGAWLAMAIEVYFRGAVNFLLFSRYYYRLARRVV